MSLSPRRGFGVGIWVGVRVGLLLGRAEHVEQSILMTEDEIFPLWRDATGEARDALTREFVKLLERHANAIVFLTLGKHFKEPVNEAIHRVLTRSDNFRGDSRFSTWFHSIVKRACLDYVRRERKGTLTEELEEEFPSGEDLETAVIEKVDLERAVGKLSPREQQLVRLRRRGYTNAEVAEQLGTTVSNVEFWWGKIWEKLPR